MGVKHSFEKSLIVFLCVTLVLGHVLPIASAFAEPAAGERTSSIAYTAASDPVDRIVLNDAEVSLDSSSSVTYPYDNSGSVKFEVETFATLTRLTSLVINTTTCALPATKAETLELIDGQIIHYTCTVPYSDAYDVSTTTARNTGDDALVGGFLWSYLDQDKGTDDYVGNGRLELVKISYNGHDYTEQELAELNKSYLNWQEFNEGQEGEAMLPVGAIATVSLIPDAGYQLTSFMINGGVFEAGEEIGVYSFEIKGGNAHLGAHFTAVDDAVTANSDSVESGSIELDSGEIGYGTARLDVNDVELSESDIADFREAAAGYSISTYLDISLYQTVYKGTATDTWDTQIRDLDSEAVITLQLEEGVDGDEIVIVHQKHDGTYEVIPTTYDPATNTISFRTSSFSNYAIASRTETAAAAPNSGRGSFGQSSAIESLSIFNGAIALIGLVMIFVKSRFMI